MGCAQMEQLPAYIDAKRAIAARYHEALAHVPGITLPAQAEWASSTFWMYTILVDEEVTRISSRELLRELHARKIQTRPLWQPMHHSPAHQGAEPRSCPVADGLHRQALSLPCSVGLTPSAQATVIDAIKGILERTSQERGEPAGRFTLMEIAGLFHSPGTELAAFAQMQTLLYRHDPALHEYFLPIQMDLLTTPRAQVSAYVRPGHIVADGLRAAEKRMRKLRRIRTDVVVCPSQHFGRASETQFFIRTVLGVLETGARVLCLIPEDASCRLELDRRIAAAGKQHHVEFFDPAASSSRVERRLRWKIAQHRGRSAFADAVRILEPHGLRLGEEVCAAFERRAYAIDALQRIAPWIEFEAAIVRCHWFELASSICQTANERGKPVITFQQGVVGHTLDFPVTASKFVAFGQCSAAFLAKGNERFYQSVGKPAPPVEFLPGGCLFDTILDLSDQFAQRTLLLVDVPTAQYGFYGVEAQCNATLQLAEKLLEADVPLRRIVIRPHPFWGNLDFSACKRLVSRYPDRCEISHPAWSLEEDLRRASVIAGIFSGVLTVAAASGLPAVFVQTPDGYTTGDLACFSPGQTLQLEDAYRKLAAILSDRDAYAAAQAESQRNARAYYHEGKTLDLNGAFFERLLAPEPVARGTA